MRFYLDAENKCHITNDGTMREVEDSCFDGKCPEYIEGFYYVPEGELAVINDVEYSGRMLSAFGDFVKMELAQAQYELGLTSAKLGQVKAELADADAALGELGVSVDG